MIDLTPLEVRKKKGDFRRALRGYEPEQVDDFLDIVADRLEQLVRENAELQERGKRLEHGVAEYRDRERALTDALVTAQEMREEIKSQTTREAELLRRTAQEEATSRVRDAEQQAETAVRDAERRAETLVHDAETLMHEAEQRSTTLLSEAEQRSTTMLREAEQRSTTMLREAEQRMESLVRDAEQQSEDRLRKAVQEAETQLREAEREAQRLRAEAKREREREESAMRRLRARQEQLLASYRTFLERELTELSAITSALEPLDAGEAESAALGEEPQARETPSDLTAGAPSFAAAAGLLGEFEEEELEPFEPEPVYEEDLEKERVARVEPTTPLREDAPEVGAESGEPVASGWPQLEVRPEFRPAAPSPEATPATPEAGDWTDDVIADEAAADAETEALLENAKRAGYRIELDEEAELLLEEPAAEDEGDDWLNSMIEETK